jgi:hypothetical protein
LGTNILEVLFAIIFKRAGFSERGHITLLDYRLLPEVGRLCCKDIETDGIGSKVQFGIGSNEPLGFVTKELN